MSKPIIPVIIVISGHRYDMTKFASRHPGEGIRGVHLKNYIEGTKLGKQATEDMDYHLHSNEPYRWLEEARAGDTSKGIIYLGEVNPSRVK